MGFWSNMLVIAIQNSLYKELQKGRAPGGCLQKMWLLKSMPSVTHDAHMGVRCAQGCGNTYVRGQTLDHYAGALLKAPSRDFPRLLLQEVALEWVLCAHPWGQSTGVEFQQGWRLRSRGSGSLTVESWVAPHSPPPAKPTLSLLVSATVPQVLCFYVLFFFFFSFGLPRSLMKLVDSGGKGWRRACLGSAPPSAFCCYHGLPLLAF